jgi:hypothetical protein
MRKYLISAGIASWVVVGVAAGGGPDDQLQQYSAQGRAYMTYDFGGARRSNDAPMPLHYGFRVDSESRLAEERYTGVTDHRFPALMQMDFASDGSRTASVNGIPFAGRALVLRQNDGSSPDSGAPTATSEPGGFTWFDWGLLAVGLGGLGYIIAEVSKGKDSPDPPPPATAGTTTGAATAAVNAITGVVNGVVNTATGTVNAVTGAVNGVLTGTTGFTGSRSVEGVLPFDPVDRDDPNYQKWLDGGKGQMGDLGG